MEATMSRSYANGAEPAVTPERLGGAETGPRWWRWTAALERARQWSAKLLATCGGDRGVVAMRSMATWTRADVATRGVISADVHEARVRGRAGSHGRHPVSA